MPRPGPVGRTPACDPSGCGKSPGVGRSGSYNQGGFGMSTLGGAAGARHGLVGLLAGLTLAWAAGAGTATPPQAKAGLPGPSEAGGTLAFTAPGPGSAQWLYLVDTKSQALAVYRVDP